MKMSLSTVKVENLQKTLAPLVTYTKADYRIIANKYYRFAAKESYRRSNGNTAPVPTRGWQPNLG